MLLMMIMSMGRDYVSELLPPKGLLFILQVIYEHEKIWWNDIDRENLLIHPSELSVNLTSSHLVTKQEGLEKEMNFPLRCIFVHTLKCYVTCHKIIRPGANSFTYPSKEGVLRNFIAPKSPLFSAGVEPAKLGSIGKHGN
jgi:hypothetical protein